MDHALRVGSLTTSDETVRTPDLSSSSSHSMQASRNDAGHDDAMLSGKADLEIEDEYVCYKTHEFYENRFTNDFYVYEQGQKEIIVKNRLRDHVEFWKSVGAGRFILDTILYCYKIPFYSLPEACILNNNQSALKENSFVTEAVASLVDKSLVELCPYAPTVVQIRYR